MKKRNRWAARLRNALFRIVKRVPRGVVSAVVKDDRFRVVESLFRFLGAFAVGQRVLYVGAQPLAAGTVYRVAEADVTALTDSARVRRFGNANTGEATMRFVGTVDERKRYGVIIDGDAGYSSMLEPDGKLLVVVGRAEDEPEVLEELTEEFATVRRFVQRARVAVDLSSPFYSTIPPDALWFSETEETPPDALAVIYLGTNDAKWAEPRLHIGSGPVALPGWVNVDIKPYPGVDFCADVAAGIPFRNVRHIFAEHFIEHLGYAEAAQFVTACREALGDDGVLRLSTPNLDWVVRTSYPVGRDRTDDERLHDCFALNRAFRAWGHQFLYTFAALQALLDNAGFASVRAVRYGESDLPELAGLEHHEQYPDFFEHSHIIVVEATGRGTAARGGPSVEEYLRDLSAR